MRLIRSFYAPICIVLAALSACDSNKSYTQFTCEEGQKSSGSIVDVSGMDHTLYSLPTTDSPAVINEKATQLIGSVQYHIIDSSTRVQIQCEKGDWVKVQLTEPEWLTHVKGWTKREYLLLPRTPGEVRTYTENDIYWDKITKNHKGLIVKEINRIHREDSRCKDYIEPSSVALSPSKSQPNAPVFFVTCGKDAGAVNVYFTTSVE